MRLSLFDSPFKNCNTHDPIICSVGVSSRSSTASFAGSPESARVVGDGSILNANHWHPSTSGTELHSSVSPKYVFL